MAHHPNSEANPSYSKNSLQDFLEDGRLAEWFSKYGKNIAYAFAALLALLVIIYRFSNSHAANLEQDYLQASNDFVVFIKSSSTQDSAAANEAFQRLNTLIQKHPELHAAYDGAIAQTLLNRNQVVEAKPFAASALNRTKSDDFPYYGDFASTTLMISEQNYRDALTQALNLQQKMKETGTAQPSSQDRPFGDELFALNLLRIGMLQQKLSDPAELETWREWKLYAGLDTAKNPLPVKIDPQVFRSVIQHLAIGSMALPDYFAYREKALAKK